MDDTHSPDRALVDAVLAGATGLGNLAFFAISRKLG